MAIFEFTLTDRMGSEPNLSIKQSIIMPLAKKIKGAAYEKRWHWRYVEMSLKL